LYLTVVLNMTNKNNLIPQVAVGAVVFRDDSVLLVKRKNHPAKNMWAIPGGRVKIGEKLQEAAEREIFEETGIQIKAGEPIYVFDVIDRDDSEQIRFHYVIIDLDAQYLSGVPEASDDAEEAKWISRDQIKSLNVNPKTKKLLKEKYNFC